MPDHAPPTTIVIFGASGDLTRRKLMPGLFNLFREGHLPERFAVAGFAWTPMTTAEFQEQMRVSVAAFATGVFTEAAWQAFADHLHYVTGGFTEAGDYARLQSFLADLEGGAAHRLYYLATAPRFFEQIVRRLGDAGMVQERPGEMAVWQHVVIEKPLHSAARGLSPAL